MKKLLVVIKDNLEYKTFVENFDFIENKYMIYLTSPVAADPKFLCDVMSLSNRINVIDIWDDSKIHFGDKVKYWLKRQFFYLKNCRQSESCFQKFWLHLGLSNSNVLGGRHRGVQMFFAYSLSRIVPSFLYKYIENFKYSSILYNNDFTFDYILFMRPDSLFNIALFNTFKTKCNKVITFIRNYDTPALKGVFTVKSDLTLVISSELKMILERIHSKSSVGKIRVIRNDKKFKKNKSKVFLYCTSHPSFFPSENIVIKEIMKKIPKDYELRILLHPSDNIDRYNLNKKFFVDLKSRFVKYKTARGLVDFHSTKTIQNLRVELRDCDSLITHSSTVVRDAFDSGVSNLYFIIDDADPYKYIFKREHISILIKDLNIKTINFQGDLYD